MSFTKLTSIRNIGFGLVALLATLPWIYAQRGQQSGRGEPSSRGESAPRNEPARAPVQHSPAVVDRSTHGSIRHVDTHVVERPVTVRHEVDIQQRSIVHHDVEVDVNHSRFWHGFVFGARRHGLWPGYIQLFVGGSPYYYDDGIYYQQVGDDYQEVYPPAGATIARLPDGAIEIDAGNIAYYYAGGAFYVSQDGGYVIAPTPLGVTVPELPPGAVPVSVAGGVAYQFNGIYYRPSFVNGVTQYMTFIP